MTSRRTFIAALATAPVAIAAPAIAAVPATQHPDWLALIADERRLHEAFNVMVDVQEEADDRYYAACEVAEREWQAAYDARRTLPAVDDIEGESADERENRIRTAIANWNAGNQAMRDQRDDLRAKVREQSGLADVEERYLAACSAHTKAIRAIVAYPSRDPDIIAHKLCLMMERYGDDSGELKPLLASIVGGAAHG